MTGLGEAIKSPVAQAMMDPIDACPETIGMVERIFVGQEASGQNDHSLPYGN